MSLAPASSRGIFLKARLAVNGIQCAARSFGTLTAVRAGLLSSILASLVGVRICAARYQLRRSAEMDNCRHLKQIRAADSGRPCPGRDAARSTCEALLRR